MYIISACLCGVNCKYSGKNNYSEECYNLFKEGKAILVCPEQLGGLSTPRNPAELTERADNIIKGNGKIITNTGEDVTKKFILGAEETLKIAKIIKAKTAILKEGSPSCGSKQVYDGTFSGKKKTGKGITAYLLEKNGIEVISEGDIAQLFK